MHIQGLFPLRLEKAMVPHSSTLAWKIPWTIACQAALSLTISQSLPKFMSIASVMPSSHLILWCLLHFCLQSFLASGTFPLYWLFASDDKNTGASASASVFPTSIQGWFPLRLTDFISLLSRKLSGVFSSTIVLRGKCSEKMTGNEEIRCRQRERDHGDE